MGLVLWLALCSQNALAQGTRVDTESIGDTTDSDTIADIADSKASLDDDKDRSAQMPVPKTQSAEYLVGFDPSGKRDPFSAMQVLTATSAEGESWWDAAQDNPSVEQIKDLYFNGQSPAECSESYARLPSIKVTGMMQIGGRSAVTAQIQSKGSCVLYENDRLVLNSKNSGNMTKWLFVKQIHSNGMTLILDDGKEISGKFY